MIQIAVCEDSVEDIDIITKLIDLYKLENSNIDFNVQIFNNPEQLLNKITSGAVFNIYLLDIVLDGFEQSGIDIGHEIRKNDELSSIVYLTSSLDYALQAFKVHAERYLIKPLKKDEFFEAIDNAVKKYANTVRYYSIKTKEGVFKVNLNEIEYLENVSRSIHLHKTDGTELAGIFLRQSFEKDVKDLLETRTFIHCHKSFLINLTFVDILRQNEVVMQSGTVIPIAKSRQSEVKRIYLRFMSET